VTSPGPGSGSGRSARVSTSGPPYSGTTTARIRLPSHQTARLIKVAWLSVRGTRPGKGSAERGARRGTKCDKEEGDMSADRHATEAHASGPARAKQRVEAMEAAARLQG